MDRSIAYGKLARGDRFVRMRARDVGARRVEQGLTPFPDRTSRSLELAGFADAEIERLVRSTQPSPVS